MAENLGSNAYQHQYQPDSTIEEGCIIAANEVIEMARNNQHN